MEGLGCRDIDRLGSALKGWNFMQIVLNGERRELATAQTVAQLVAELGLPAPALLVEHNGVALRRAEWDGCLLCDSDRVEIIRIVAGG